jgi:predicted dehydrogenase
MAKTQAAVVGVGYLGKFHAEKYATLPDVDLVAVVDTDPAVAQAASQRLGVDMVTDYRALLGKVEAVSVVVPTQHHHRIAADFLRHGAHVLIEKPIAETVAQADELIALAAQNKRVLQVGHLERFNAAVMDLWLALDEPMFIESHRLAPFRPRGTDVSVVLDLLIHDIDIILNIVRSDVKRIAASGAAVLSDAVDIVNARLEFKSGCVANVTASRISLKTERKMRIFQRNAYISVDFQERVLSIRQKGKGEMFPGIPNIETEEKRYPQDDALMSEIAHFVKTLREGGRPLVSGEDGRRALQTASEISALISANVVGSSR